MPASGLAQDPIRPDDGWCDAPSSPMYNQAVRHPYAASAEHLWRADHLYDIIVVLGHNDAPVVPGHGSAIFLHVARADLSPTEGCIALNLNDLLAFLTLVPGLWGVTVAGA